jgi:hypothetical protein
MTLHKKKNGHRVNKLFLGLGILRCDAIASGSSNPEGRVEGSSKILVYDITFRF